MTRSTPWVLCWLILLAGACFPPAGDRNPERIGATEEPLSTCLPDDELPYFPASPSWFVIDVTGIPAGGDITSRLQQAIHDHSGNPGDPGMDSPVIVIPQGSWTISKTIYMGTDASGTQEPTLARGAYSPTILGGFNRANPTAKTTLSWSSVAPLAGDMFVVADTQGLKLSRIALQGNGRARIGVHVIQACHVTPGNPCVVQQQSSDHHEFSDDSFDGLSYGLVAGDFYWDYARPGTPSVSLSDPHSFLQASPTNNGTSVVRRTSFSNISGIGLLLQGSNAFDWNVFDCSFTSNRIGVQGTDFFAAANVFHSNFFGSTFADMVFSQQDYVMIRDNYSSGSNRFVYVVSAGNISNTGVIGNAIDARTGPSQSPPVEIDAASSLILNNTILTNSGPAVQVGAPSGQNPYADLTEGGNRFSVARATAISAGPAYGLSAFNVRPGIIWPASSDQGSLTGLSLVPNILAQPAVPRLRTYGLEVSLHPHSPQTGTLCDVNTIPGYPTLAGFPKSDVPCAPAISNLPDSTAVHIRAGIYVVTSYIFIQQGRDVLYAGDGSNTQVKWGGASNYSAVFYMNGTTGGARGSIRDMIILVPSGYSTGGILIAGADDTTGSRVYADQFSGGSGVFGYDVGPHQNLAFRSDGGWMNGFDTPLRSTGVGAGVQVPRTSIQGVKMFGGELNGTTNNSVDVQNWGKVVLQGVDAEQLTQAATLSGSGYVTLAEGRHETANSACNGFAPEPVPVIPHGNFTMAATFQGSLTIADYKTTSKVNAAQSAGQFLGINIINNDDQLGYDRLTCCAVYEQAPNCDSAPFLAPESTAGVDLAVTSCLPPPEVMTFGATIPQWSPPLWYPTPSSGACGFVSLNPSMLLANANQANLNGRFYGTGSSCVSNSASCQSQGQAIDAGTDGRLVDLIQATSDLRRATCGPTDVRIHRVFVEGPGVASNGLPFALRVN